MFKEMTNNEMMKVDGGGFIDAILKEETGKDSTEWCLLGYRSLKKIITEWEKRDGAVDVLRDLLNW
jgi:bacteriocin-like protein